MSNNKLIRHILKKYYADVYNDKAKECEELFAEAFRADLSEFYPSNVTVYSLTPKSKNEAVKTLFDDASKAKRLKAETVAFHRKNCTYYKNVLGTIEDGFGALTLKEMDVIEMTFVLGNTEIEISFMEKVTIRTVSRRLKNAFDKLYAVYKRDMPQFIRREINEIY